jgi:hypothetical protein
MKKSNENFDFINEYFLAKAERRREILEDLHARTKESLQEDIEEKCFTQLENLATLCLHDKKIH